MPCVQVANEQNRSSENSANRKQEPGEDSMQSLERKGQTRAHTNSIGETNAVNFQLVHCAINLVKRQT